MYALPYYIEIALSQFGADISYFLHVTALGETDLNVCTNVLLSYLVTVKVVSHGRVIKTCLT